MARPRKQTVDYFPHMCTHGQTMFILEQRYGNDGYAFWFKLLEMLGTSEGHYIDLRNAATREYLQAKTHIEWDKCREILDLLATVGSIDAELWTECQVVWSAKFVDNIALAYRNRKVEMPRKPDFLREKPRQSEVIDTSYCKKPTYEMKLNETRLNETRVDNVGDNKPSPPKPAERKSLTESSSPVHRLIGHFASRFEEKFGKPPAPNWSKDGKIMKELLNLYDERFIQYLIDLFFNQSDEFVKRKAGYTVGVFRSQLDRLISISSARDAPYRETELARQLREEGVLS